MHIFVKLCIISAPLLFIGFTLCYFQFNFLSPILVYYRQHVHLTNETKSTKFLKSKQKKCTTFFLNICVINTHFLIKVVATDMRYFARSKIWRSSVHKKKFGLTWKEVFKLEYFTKGGRITYEFEWTRRKVMSYNYFL